MQLMTTKEAAEYLKYSHYTLRQSRSTGKLGGNKTPKFIQIGRNTVRYKKEDLDSWVQDLITQNKKLTNNT